MIVSDGGQAKVFLINILCGMVCVFLFDLCAVAFKSKNRSVLWLNVVDLCYYITVFVLILFVGIKYNFGALRYYQIAGLLIGVCLHSLLFAKIERRVLRSVLKALFKLLKLLKKIFALPLVFALRAVFTPVLFCESKIMELSDKVRKRMKRSAKKRKKAKKTVKKRIKMI